MTASGIDVADRSDPAADTIRVDLPNGMTVLGFNRDEIVFLYDEIFVARSYWHDEIELQPGDCVFDVGANIGLFTLWLDRFRSGLRHYAVEPIPAVFDALRCNARTHAPPARLLNHGFGAASGTGVFTHYPNCSGWSTLCPQPDDTRAALYACWRNAHRRRMSRFLGPLERRLFDRAVDPLFASRPVSCRILTLSGATRSHGIERIDLLKIDVERSELDVLTGIEARDWPGGRQIVMEVEDSDDRLAQIRDLLARQRYAVSIRQAPHLDGTRYYNVHALRR